MSKGIFQSSLVVIPVGFFYDDKKVALVQKAASRSVFLGKKGHLFAQIRYSPSSRTIVTQAHVDWLNSNSVNS